MAEKFKAICLGASKGLFVTENDTGGVVFDTSKGDEPFTESPFGRVRDLVILEVDVNPGGRVANQDADESSGNDLPFSSAIRLSGCNE